MTTPTRLRRTPRPKGYSIGIELTGLLAERYPELSAKPEQLTEPVALVVEFSGNRGFDLGQLARDLDGRGQMKAVVARPRGAGPRLVTVVDVNSLREHAVECEQAGRMLRLERSLRAAAQ
ncbi:hypothetical protein [Streptomyces chattanoogensis]|uniref:hypothetical protein n=1 Tax=Streptomyces chattanoogensis TaxID=66876 RepID=UPI0036C1B87B